MQGFAICVVLRLGDGAGGGEGEDGGVEVQQRHGWL